MRVGCRFLRELFAISPPVPVGPLLLLATLTASPALSQNLLVNPGFDRDLSGWELRTYFSYTGGNPGASAAWDATDVHSGNSGSARFQLRGYRATINRVLLSQCVAAVPGHRYTGGGLIRTDSQLLNGVLARLELFTSAGCAGDPVTPGPPDGYSLTPMLYTSNNSDGRWLPASVSVVASTGVQSLRFSAGLDAVTYGSLYTLSSFDGLFDDAFLFEQADPAATWILPSSAKVPGAAGSLWTTTLTLVNGGSNDALVTMKFLGHDADGRSGGEKSVLIRAGTTDVFLDVVGSLFGQTQDYGAIWVTSSSLEIAVQSETSTPFSGGTVGQALPAFGANDFASSTPKMLAPIHENASFRSNLVLANATEAQLTAHIELFAVDGTSIGARDVELPPLGMTQINRVTSALGATILDLGRIAVSTPTPGGLVAAYASVIDNVTNDPRTLLPRDASGGLNLLVNPGFARDLGGWTAESHILPDPARGKVSATWTATDTTGDSASGGLSLHAEALLFGSAQMSLSQCVAAPEGGFVWFGAKFLTASQAFSAGTSVDVTFFASTDCAGVPLGSRTATSLPSDIFSVLSSNGLWLPAASQILSSPGTHSIRVGVSADAATPGLGLRFGSVDAVADDVFVMAAPAEITPRILPATAWIHGDAGSYWTTRFTLCNPGPTDAAITLKWLGHDVDGRFGLGTAYVVRASQTFVPDEWVNHPEDYGAILVISSSPALVVQSETSTYVLGGGTVGQALPAFGPPDFAGVTPKTLAPIRENAAFRTNLVLANTTEAPLTAHVALYAADGRLLGARDVDLPPLGMTQINRVASALGTTILDLGRIAVSTPTPGGLVAAYASVIDNVTNDPRTLLPR